MAIAPLHTGPATFPIMVTLETIPNTMLLFSGGTDSAIYVLAIGMMNPIPKPVAALKNPRPHILGIRYCMIKVSPAKNVDARSTFFIGIRAVTLPTESEQAALTPPARKIMIPTVVAIKSASPPIISLI